MSSLQDILILYNSIIKNIPLLILQVDINGYFLFRRGLSQFIPSAFPGSLTHIVAIFWTDVDIRVEGEISYEVHTTGSSLLSQVNNFISTNESVAFTGTWMLVAEWDRVRQFPHGTVGVTSPVSVRPL